MSWISCYNTFVNYLLRKLPCWVRLPWDTLTRPKWDQPASPDHQALHCIPAVKGNNHKYYQLIMLWVPIYIKGLRMRYPISRRLSASQFKKNLFHWVLHHQSKDGVKVIIIEANKFSLVSPTQQVNWLTLWTWHETLNLGFEWHGLG